MTRVRERCYEARRVFWIDHLRHDVRSAARQLYRRPGVTLVAILSLACGIGATTVTLTVRDLVFRKPPPLYAEPAQLSRVQAGRPDRPIMAIGSGVPAPLYEAWRGAIGLPVAASLGPRGVRDLGTGDREASVPVRAVSHGLFPLLGVAPALGRPLAAGQGGSPEALLSDRIWERLFDRRSDVIGRIVWIDNQAHTIVGVMPARFWFAEMNAPIWTALERQALQPDDRLEVVVRRPQGMPHAVLEARLQAGLAEFASRQPTDSREWRLKVSGIEGTPIGHQVAPILPYVLGTAVLLTLLIACANVAILMIAQWSVREHEIAIRASIGASRGRIVRALLAESVLIAACGGALGVGVTFALRGWIVHRAAADRGNFNLAIDPGIFLWTAVLTLLTGVLAGIGPALYETRLLQANPLRTVAASDRIRQRWREALVVAEITATIALLVVTAAMVDGWNRARSARLGFDTRQLIHARVENPGGLPVGALLQRLGNVPGVAAVGAATMVPYAPGGRRVSVGTDAAGANAVMAESSSVSAGYFDVLGVTLRAGREFEHRDEDTRAAIVNETLVRRLFGDRSPLGSPVWIAGTRYDLVGVVADYSNNPLQPSRAEAKVFLPLGQTAAAPRSVNVLVRTGGDPATLVQSIRRAAAGGGTVVPSVFPVDEILRIMQQELLLGTAPPFPLIAIGMLLTAAGIYGVLSFAITRRTRELAVRVAVGATGPDLVRLVSSQTVRLLSIGAGLGIAATYALARVVRAGGGAGTVFDPQTIAFVVPLAIILAIGALATWLPSRRALTIDPATLFREG